MKRFLAVLMTVIMLMSMIPAVSLAAPQYAAVVGGWLRLRSDNSFESETITSYYTGTVVEILGSYGNWYYVRTPDGRIGYMYGDFLQLGVNGNGSTVKPDAANAFVTSHNGYGVRLRKGPGTGYRVIHTYAVGTPVTVLEQGTNWCRVSINGTVGYMMSQFLNFDSSANGNGDHSVLCYATIWSSNGYGVRLRSGPSTSYGKIGVYSVGTSVAVLEKGTTWDRIRVGSRTGWMMNDFLIYQNANEVTSVSLNNLYPTVGTVMKVKAMSPSHATVSYQWYADSTLRSTNSTYTVSAADVGKVIQLKISGTGAYSGSAWSAQTAKVISNKQISSLKLSTTAPVVGDVLKASFTPADAAVAYAWKVDGYQVSNQAAYKVTANDVGKTIELIVSGTGSYSGTLSASTAAVAASSMLTNVTIRNESNATVGAVPMVGDTLTAVVAPSQATATYQWYRNGAAISGANSASYKLADADLGARMSVTVKGNGAYAGEKSASIADTVASRPAKPVIDDYAMPEAMVGKTYATQLTAQGGGQITWTLTGGSLPEGMNLSENGAITGTPAQAGDYPFTVKASNVAGSDEKAFAMKVAPAAKPQLTVSSITLPALTEGYDQPQPLAMTILNSGNADAVLTGLWTAGTNGDCFMVNETGRGVIAAGETDTSWTVQPKSGLAAGTYTADFVVSYNGGVATASVSLTVEEKFEPTAAPTAEPTAEPTASPTVEPTPEPTNTPETKARLTVDSLTLPTLTEGYEQPSPAAISISNVGNADAVLQMLWTEGANGDCFIVNENGRSVIAAGTTDTTWTIQPKAGLAAGTYSASFVVSYVGGTATAAVTLVVIEKPEPTTEPTAEPTAEPTPEPTPEPTAEPLVYVLTVNGGTGSGMYEEGAQITLTADVPADKNFVQWENNVGAISDPHTITTIYTMPGRDAEVTAIFADKPPVVYQLTVTGGNGSGNYEEGTQITLTADIPADKDFVKWENDAGAISDPYALTTIYTMPAKDAAVTAVFADKPPAVYQLTVIGGSGSNTYEAGTVIELTAAVPEEMEFESWTNDAGAISNPYTAVTSFTMPASPAVVTAHFKERVVAMYTLTVNGGSGSGTYPEGQVVDLIANDPDKGMEFGYWDNNAGAVANARNSVTTFVMPAKDATVNACFNKVSYQLTVTNGTEETSFTDTYNYGAVIELNAASVEGKVFSHWENTAGAIANANQSITTFTMPAANASITAVYTAVTE